MVRKYEDLHRYNVRVVDISPTSRDEEETPRHVQSLIDTLLHFEDILDSREETDYRRHLDLVEGLHQRRSKGQSHLPPAAAYYGRSESSAAKTIPAEDHITSEEFRECCRISNSFKFAMRSNEEDLTIYYLLGIFEPPDLYRRFNTGHGASRRGAWTMLKNIKWTEDFTCFRPTTLQPSPGSELVKSSVPDLVYGIRMLQSDNDRSVPTGEGFEKYYDNFKFPFLAALRQQLQVQSTITATLSRVDCSCREGVEKAQEALTYHDRMCFPFAIVELKRSLAGPSDEETCETQAAAAAVRALSLLKTLYEKTQWQDSGGKEAFPLPCCVAFTCVGTDVKVWLAYEEVEQGSSRVTMRCIYSTTMLLPWGVISLRCIIRKMLMWSWDVFRSDISNALQRVKHSVKATTSRMNIRKEAMKIVDSVDEHGSHGQAIRHRSNERSSHAAHVCVTVADEVQSGQDHSVQNLQHENEAVQYTTSNAVVALRNKKRGADMGSSEGATSTNSEPHDATAPSQAHETDSGTDQMTISEPVARYAKPQFSRKDSMALLAAQSMDPFPPLLTDESYPSVESGQKAPASDNALVLYASPANAADRSHETEPVYVSPNDYENTESWRRAAYTALSVLDQRAYEYYFGSLVEDRHLQEPADLVVENEKGRIATQHAPKAEEDTAAYEEDNHQIFLDDRESLFGRCTYYEALQELDLDALSAQQIDYLSFYLDSFEIAEDSDPDSDYVPDWCSGEATDSDYVSDWDSCLDPDSASDTTTTDDDSSVGSSPSISTSEVAFTGPYTGTKSQTIYLVEGSDHSASDGDVEGQASDCSGGDGDAEDQTSDCPESDGDAEDQTSDCSGSDEDVEGQASDYSGSDEDASG